MDLESELQRMLHTREIPVAPGDPVPAVHAGIRRRRRTQRLQVLAAGTSVVVIALAASLTLSNHLSANRQAPAAPPVQPTAQTVGAVPPGFQVRDVSFSSQLRAWALGTAGCKAGTCTVLLASTDAGKSWQASNGPAAVMPSADGTFSADCTQVTCVSHLRFATSKTGDLVGYAYGPGLAISTDGGQTWVNQSLKGAVVALEAANGNVIRVVDPLGGCPCSSFDVEASSVGSDAWSATSKAVGQGELVDARLTRQGQRLALLLTGHTAGGASSASSTLLLSTDNGSRWVTHADPCSKAGVIEQDAIQVALAANGIVTALCQDRSGAGTSVTVSTDGGKTYAPRHTTGQVANHLIALPGALLVSATDKAGGHRVVLRSTDSGRTWTQVASQLAKSDNPSRFLGFTSDTQGTWIGADDTRLVRTTDGGLTWTDRPFR